MKVYGWLGYRPHDLEGIPERRRHRYEARCIVAARSKAEVARIVGIPAPTQTHIHNLGETGNEQEIALALSEPGVVFYMDDYNHTPGERVYKRHPYNGNTRP